MGAIETDILVIGAGLAGLSAAATLGSHATVVEQLDAPGGLARTECFDGWWFDRVLHLLHFANPEVERTVRELVGTVLAPCPPEARIVSAAGTVRYPFQLHLAGLDVASRTACVADFAKVSYAPQPSPANFEELLLTGFGRAMCEQFYFPYNRKLWRRPLRELATQGFQWNLTRPSFEDVLRGAFGADGRESAYNSNGWYIRPPAGAPTRGMQVLSDAWAHRLADLRLRHRVRRIDTDRRVVECEHDGRTVSFHYRRACLSTVPLPSAIELCSTAPTDLRAECRRLPRIRVRSVALSVTGQRPDATVLWQYHTDESVPFTRLIFQTNLDPLLAPEHGWGLMAEVTERAEDEPAPARRLIQDVLDAVCRLGILPAGCQVRDANVMDVDPAYVVFTPRSIAVTRRAEAVLTGQDILPLGRYGRWEYSSMAQVMADGMDLAKTLMSRYGWGRR